MIPRTTAAALLVCFSVLTGAAPASSHQPATSATGVATLGLGTWLPPLFGPTRVSRPFDPPRTPYGPGHRGVDLAAVVGQLVRAPTAGLVVFAGPVAGRGVVSIRAVGFRTTFEPVIPLVRIGQLVVPGQPIAVVAPGHLHCPTCLHWGLRNSSGYLDPMLMLRPHRVRLVSPHSDP